MAGTYIRYPSSGGTTINKYANAAALPATAADGTLAITLDNHNLLEFFTSDMMWHVIGSSSSLLGVGTIDSNGASANGASVNGSNQLIMQSASATVPGLVNTTTQTLAGVKTFSSAPNLSSLTASLPLQLDASKNVISAAIDLSTTEVTGVLPFSKMASIPGSKTLFVDKNRTDSYTPDGSISRPFLTIQAAVNQIIANGDNSTSVPYVIDIIGSGTYAENVTLNNLLLVSVGFSGANASGGGAGSSGVSISPASGNCIDASSNVSNLQNLAFNTISFTRPINLINDVNNSNFGFVGINFINCIINTASNVNGCRILTMTNCRTSTWSTINILSATVVNMNYAGTMSVTVDTVNQRFPVGFVATSTFSGRAVSMLTGYTDSVGAVATFYNPIFANSSQNIIGTVTTYGGAIRGPLTIQSGASLTTYGTWVAGTVANSGTWTNNNNLKDADVASAAAIAVNKLAALTASRAVASDVSGFLTVSPTTSTELGFVNGVTSSIQTQLNAKEPTVTKGNLTDVGTDGIVITGGTGAVIGSGTSIAQTKADATHNGYLSSTDWSTFNGKQASGNYITALTGDVTATGPGSVASTIAAGAVTATKLGTVTDGITLDQSGAGSTLEVKTGGISNAQINTSAAIAFSKLASLTSAHILVGSAGNVATDVAVSGDISLTNAGVTAYSGTVPLNKGGTGQTTKAAAFDALQPMTTGGDLIYGGASGTGTRLANGSAGQVLTSQGTTLAPIWSSAGTGTITGPGSSTNTAVPKWNGTGGIALSDSGVLIGGSNQLTIPGGIVGSDGTTSAATGIVGEFLNSVITSVTSFPASAAYGDGTSLSLTAGDWDVTACLDTMINTAVFTGGIRVGISTTTGNSSTGLQQGDNLFLQNPPTATSAASVVVPSYRMLLTATTTVYLKLLATYSSGTPQYRCRLSARRVR